MERPRKLPRPLPDAAESEQAEGAVGEAAAGASAEPAVGAGIEAAGASVRPEYFDLAKGTDALTFDVRVALHSPSLSSSEVS